MDCKLENHETAVEVNVPYPEIRVAKPNPLYATMILDNVGGINSEMSAVATYVYNHIKCDEIEVKKIFFMISITEMKHLQIFSELAKQLGTDPRLWSKNSDKCKYWSPSYIKHCTRTPEMICSAIKGENAAIAKYEHQLQIINDSCIKDILKRILMDEHKHIELLKSAYRKINIKSK